ENHVMKSKRIILDTNLWISFLITKNYTNLENLIRSQNVVLIFSEELLEEFLEVTRRQKFLKYFSKRDTEKLLNTFDKFAELVEITSKLKICRDEKDNFLLDLAVDGNVDYLITGDKDLLILDRIKKTQILTYQEFLEKIVSKE